MAGFTSCTATTAGDAWSERTLISVYAFGEYGVKPDWDKAAAWCKRAADHGEGMGIYCIGGMYNEGKGGYPLDIVQATKWFEKAAAGSRKAWPESPQHR